jgi:hypothetical protein
MDTMVDGDTADRGTGDGPAVVVAVSTAAGHTFSKPNRDRVRLLAGLGVEGDAHLGVTVRHRSRVARDPTQPNLRQVHLIAAELLDELRADGFPLVAGELGENVTTRGVDLLGLPAGTLLRLGPDAVVEVTGLRNPCRQIEEHRGGLLARVVGRGPDGRVLRRAGVMAVVRTGGEVAPGDHVGVRYPAGERRPLEVV